MRHMKKKRMKMKKGGVSNIRCEGILDEKTREIISQGANTVSKVAGTFVSRRMKKKDD